MRNHCNYAPKVDRAAESSDAYPELVIQMPERPLWRLNMGSARAV